MRFVWFVLSTTVVGDHGLFLALLLIVFPLIIYRPPTNTSVNIEGTSSVPDNEDEAAKAVRSIQTILGHNDLESEQEKLASLRTAAVLSHHQRNNSFEEVEANKENSEVAEQLKQLRTTTTSTPRPRNQQPTVSWEWISGIQKKPHSIPFSL